MSIIPKNSFSCEENTENGGTHLWVVGQGNEIEIHTLGPWQGNFRAEFVVYLSDEQKEEFKRQVAAM